MSKQKLELTWIGKERRAHLEPRILLEDRNLSYRAASSVIDSDIFDNVLIHGDNLLALKALEQEFTGKIKCIFIDPPYNTGSAFTHYDDGIEHSLWLSLMRDRIEILHRLLAEDGSLWVTLDDNEAFYFKVMADEIFGRNHFIGTIIWQHSVQGKNDAKLFSLHHNYIFAWRKSDKFQTNKLPRSEEHNKNYSNPDNDPKGLWRSGDVRSPNLRENLRYTVTTPSGKKILPPEKGWRWAESTFYEKVETGEISFIANETKVLRKIYLCEQEGRVPETIWFGSDCGTTRSATNHLAQLLPDIDPFPTPKPEELIQRVLQVATKNNDIVLDSFAGSGTTGAVAHKMGRRWIMVELGSHCESHIIPRLRKVIDGEDKGGITEQVNWSGGGGFRFYRLAPSLLEKDNWGNLVINDKYNAEMLSQAICKHFGFTYAPNDNNYFIHGHSSERDFIFVTTNSLTHDQLRAISEEIGDTRTLLVCCKAFKANIDAFENLTVTKIPNSILRKCEWGHDDYSLKIENLPPVIDSDMDAQNDPQQLSLSFAGSQESK